MATEILTQEDLQQFRLQLLEDLKTVFPQSHQAPKQWQILVAHNGFYPCAEEQNIILVGFVNENKLSLITTTWLRTKVK